MPPTQSTNQIQNPKAKSDRNSDLAKLSRVMPCKIVFLSGQYAGKALNLGNGGITKTTHSQSSDWTLQDGTSLRVGSNFKSVGTRTIELELEFYDPQNDVAPLVENVFCLEEIDPATGSAPTFLYTEGAIKNIAPLKCSNIRAVKDYVFPGDKGFHYAKVTLSIELLGGKNSEHRFAKPLMKTELTEFVANTTKAERERIAKQAVTQIALAKCLKPQENEQIQELLRDKKAADPGALKRLSPSALVQASVAGLIPKEALAQIQPELSNAIALQIAQKTPGAGKNAGRLAEAIRSGNVSGLPEDLKSQVESLQVDFAQIVRAVLNQDLSTQSEVFANASTAQTLIQIASCGMTMRQGGAPGIAKDQQLPPEWEAYFKKKLGAKASDPVARDQFVVDAINKTLGNKDLKDEEIAAKFSIQTDQVAILKNSLPFKSKDDFILRAGASKGQTVGVSGRSAFTSFVDDQIANEPNSPAV